MALTFGEELTITIIDKGAFGLLLVVAGFVFNKMLEKFKTEQTKTIDELKADQANRIEALKSDLTRNLELDRERRTAIADFAKNVSVGYQAMAWLTWKPKNGRKSFSEKDIVEYNDDMKRAFPQIVAARVVANSLGGGVTQRLAEQLYNLDSELAIRCGKFSEAHDDPSRAAAAREIGDMHQRITEADEAFVNEISKLAAAPRSLQPDD
jgi:hypothetical protein